MNAQRQKALDEARIITDKADAEGRDLTPEESEQANALVKEAEGWVRKAIGEREKVDLGEKMKGLGSPVFGEITAEEPLDSLATARDVGSYFVRSGLFKALSHKKKDGTLGKQFRSESIEIPDRVWQATRRGKASPVLESGMDDAAGDVFGSYSGATAGILNTLLAGLAPPVLLRPALGDLIPTITVTTGNSVTYPVYSRAGVNLSGTSGEVGSPAIMGSTAEGATKHAMSYDASTVTKILFKLAAYIKVSEELLEDAPGMASFINADLPLQVRQAEEVYLASVLYAGSITADGTGVSGTNAWDAILDAENTVQLAGFEPNGMVIHPTDWASLRAITGGTSTGYIGGGPFGGTGTPWGVGRVVVTPAATSGTALVGDFTSGAKIYRKGGLSVDSTNSDQDDFVRNLVTIRAEERLVCGVSYTGAFCEATVTVGS
jgi:HK97 family phage major capsid protein